MAIERSGRRHGAELAAGAHGSTATDDTCLPTHDKPAGEARDYASGATVCVENRPCTARLASCWNAFTTFSPVFADVK